MKSSLKIGFGFGLTSGIITTLGLIIGLHFGTQSKLAVIGGVLTIAFADALSDSLGIHISQEYENESSKKEVWEATISAFLSKLLFALTFVVPLYLLPAGTAIVVCVVWGLSALLFLSFMVGKQREKNVLKYVFEHVFIAFLVIVVSYFIGKVISTISV